MKYLINQHGVALIAVLVAVAILGLMSGIAGETVQTMVQRAKEKELLWRGNQYRQAIESYYKAPPAGTPGLLPSSLEALLKDPRSTSTVRHLRQLYNDPLTGKDLIPIKGPGGRITGVRSGSSLEPFKKDNFSKENKNFANKIAYSDWQFVFEPKTVKKTTPKKSSPALQRALKSPFSGSPQIRPGTGN